jgi:hypothetical protein
VAPHPYFHPGHAAESIDEIAPPEGHDGVWQRYVITQGANTIVGMRPGVLADVSLLLEQQVERLNLRFAKQLSKAKR